MIMQRLSLLARGTPKIVAPVEMVWRFIPAGAGNTLKCLSAWLICAVYPRWRGEHSDDAVITGDCDCLSPLARGTHIQAFKTAQLFRFIPAGAGNTYLQ
ncbi:hypothetical protein SEEM9199_02684 [Salmonella enterica subsp. enterica serovar Montevideo str. IA_2009159199]|nr:hypothetical protein SEEM9199_02684 [Salmonella enterica subsp. enterica serovar Montevideo str. IA_2009159199]